MIICFAIWQILAERTIFNSVCPGVDRAHTVGAEVTTQADAS